MESNINNSDIIIEDKYSLLQEFERIKLPVVYNKICSKARFIAISSRQSSWNLLEQCKLIESLIINIPVPPIILYKESKEDYEIVDGKERLKAINNFYSNQLILSGLEIRTELNGSTYKSLPIRIKSLLSYRALSFISIIPDSSLSHNEIAKLIDIIAQRLGS